MLQRLLRLLSLACCALLIASFVMFARDQFASASKHQQNELVSSTQTGPVSSPHRSAQPRRFIDGAAHTLTAPFNSIVNTNSIWVNHGVPIGLGLLLYGVGLGYLARYTQGVSKS